MFETNVWENMSCHDTRTPTHRGYKSDRFVGDRSLTCRDSRRSIRSRKVDSGVTRNEARRARAAVVALGSKSIASLMNPRGTL